MQDSIKERIDSIRNILSPKYSDLDRQADIIIGGLVYKLMNDNNRFIDLDMYERFSWKTLHKPEVDILDRYDEIIKYISTDDAKDMLIFKKSLFTEEWRLRKFLSEIEKFNVQEDLGRLVDYFVQAFGNLGGQSIFRTPRHIVDFIVEMVKPLSGDTVLDPACGTSDFLISAYQYAKSVQYQNAFVKVSASDFYGTDIASIMIRLSYFNLYLNRMQFA